MTYQDNHNTKLVDVTFGAWLGWLAAAATIIATIASMVTMH